MTPVDCGRRGHTVCDGYRGTTGLHAHGSYVAALAAQQKISLSSTDACPPAQSAPAMATVLAAHHGIAPVLHYEQKYIIVEPELWQPRCAQGRNVTAITCR